MKKAFAYTVQAVNRCFEGIAIVCLVVVIVAMIVQVFTRYVMNASMIGTEELGRFFFIWATMLGSSLCIPSGAHAVISLLNDSIRGKIKITHLIIIDILIMVMAVLLIVQGFKMVFVTMRQLSPILHVPMAYIYLAIPVGGVGIFLNVIHNLLGRFGKEQEAAAQ